jgi:hypothetical protein
MTKAQTLVKHLPNYVVHTQSFLENALNINSIFIFEFPYIFIFKSCYPITSNSIAPNQFEKQVFVL